MAYTTQAQIEAYLDRELSDGEAALIDVLIDSVMDLFDGYCGRSFSVDRAFRGTVDNTTGDKSNDSFLRFDGGDIELFFDQPLQTDTAIDGLIKPRIGALDTDTGTWTLIDANDYVLYPLNAKVKTSVMRQMGVFPYGSANIFVYGTFSDYVTPPQGIVTAATIVCADIINLPDGLKSETIEGYAREFSQDWNPTVQKLLNVYKRVIL